MNGPAPAARAALGLLAWGSVLGIALAAVGVADRDGRAAKAEAVGLRLDPNTASAVELTLLPAIGPARAAGIVTSRQDRAFRTAGDLVAVHGIGPATIEQIQGFLRFEDSPTRVEEPSP